MNPKLLALYGLKFDPFSPEVPTEALYLSPKIENFCWRTKSQGERRRSSAGDEPRVARESGAPDYGVEANGEDRASRAK